MRPGQVRIIGGLLLATGLCLAPASPAITQMPRPEGSAAGPRPHYPNCDYIKKLGLDVLDDGISIPEAWSQNSASMGTGTELSFHVYALTNELRFYQNISSYRRAITTRIRGLGPLRGTVRFTEEGGNPRWVFRINRRPRHGRLVSLTVTYRCGPPYTRYQARIFVEIPGTLPPPG